MTSDPHSPPPTQARTLTDLESGVATLVGESALLRVALAETERRTDRDRRVNRALWALVGLLTVLSVSTFTLYATRSSANVNTLANLQMIAKEQERLNARVADCTDPRGECARENRRATQALVDRLLDRNRELGRCVLTSATEEEYVRCTAQR